MTFWNRLSGILRWITQAVWTLGPAYVVADVWSLIDNVPQRGVAD